MCTYDNIACSEWKEPLMLYVTEEKHDTHVFGFKLISTLKEQDVYLEEALQTIW